MLNLLLASLLALFGLNYDSSQQVDEDVPAYLLGSFVDDYGIEYEVSEGAWVQRAGTRYHIAKWNPAGRYLIARNDAGWTRIDWVRLEGMAPYEWAFCYSAYDVPSAAEAESTRVARPETPRTGCNGHPYSRMRRAGALDDASSTVADPLSVELVANAGVMVSDGQTSLLVDLPYQSGAYGYDTYDASALNPPGRVVSVITHDHADHFDREAFVARADWSLIADPTLTTDIPDSRVVNDYTVGAFEVVAIPTPHSEGHRSYRVEWRDGTLQRSFYFTGDTEDTATISAQPGGDILYVTPWLYCTLVGTGTLDAWKEVNLYHTRPDGNDPACQSEN